MASVRLPSLPTSASIRKASTSALRALGERRTRDLHTRTLRALCVPARPVCRCALRRGHVVAGGPVSVSTNQLHTTMKLPTHIRHDGFDHDQLTRTAGHALYRKSKGAGHCSYEVITIQRAKADYTWPSGKKTLKGTESYPSSTLWGRAGWSFQTLREAEATFATLTAAMEDCAL